VGKRRRTGTLVALGIVAAAVLAAAGCGDSASVSDEQIIKSLNLVRSQQNPGYDIGADPFCEVDLDLLGSEDEINAAKDSSEGELVVTNSDGTVGVQAVPPFDRSCGKKARRGLDALP
jgi:hypothetical protein